MKLFATFARALRLLAAEGARLWAIVAANAVLGIVLLAEPLLFGRVIDALANQRDAFGIIFAWSAIGLFGIVAGVVIAVIVDRLAHRNRLKAMELAFSRTITLPINYQARKGAGAVVRTILAGSDNLFAIWLSFFREQVAAVFTILLLLPVAFYMNWKLAILLVLLAGIYAALNALVVHKTSDGQGQVEKHHIAVAGRVGDVIGNVTVVQSYTRLAAEVSQIRVMMQQLLEAQYPVLTWWGLLTVLTRSASTVTMIAIFFLGAWLARTGEVTIGEIVSFVGFAGLLIGKLELISGFLTRFFMQAPTLRSYFELLDVELAIGEKPDALKLANVNGHVRYENVSFRHGPGEQGVFDLEFEVQAGRTIALVGPTGSGKTTTLALLQRLRDTDCGRILVDGHDVRDLTLDSLRASIAVVFQDAGLFNRSILENIRVGRPDATREEIEEAARLAEADGFIRQKPGNYDFMAGERGAALSGGERQRLAIARAILKNAPILILDEATSALDTATEARIKTALDRLRHGRTTFIIAHRLSTVASANHILVFDKGRIVEQGSFAALRKAGGLFASLVDEGSFNKPSDQEKGTGDKAPAPQSA
ncbi:MAG: hypothetical protein RLZ98_2087 [Pseudomonadota bacterium]|jgi:ATP-binding cassette subfamily B protein